MCRLMSREVVRVATWKSRVSIFRISDLCPVLFEVRTISLVTKAVKTFLLRSEKFFREEILLQAGEKIVLPVTRQQSYSDNTSGRRYLPLPSASMAIGGQPGVVVIISIPSLDVMQVSSTFDPVIDGFHANA